MKRILAISLFLFFLFQGKTQTLTDEFSMLNAYFDSINIELKKNAIDSVFKEMVKIKRFNGILLVALDTQILYENFNGYADYSKKTKLSKFSQYEIASVSKQFTAVAILQLYEQNRLKLTDTIGQYISNFPYPNITIHQLLCHRSGLPDYLEFAPKYHQNENYRMSNDSLLKMMQHFHPKALAKPNAKFDYSNTGYAVLAIIVEKITQQPFENYLQEHIFDPIGMTHTFLFGKGEFSTNGFTIGHRSNYKMYKRDFMSEIVGDKAVFTTAEDLFLWNRALYDGKILKDSTLQLAYTPKNSECPENQNYGYGWRLTKDTHQHEIIYHGGLWNGNNTLFMRRLYDKSCVIILSNCFNRSFGGRGDQIMEILYDL